MWPVKSDEKSCYTNSFVNRIYWSTMNDIPTSCQPTNLNCILPTDDLGGLIHTRWAWLVMERDTQVKDTYQNEYMTYLSNRMISWYHHVFLSTMQQGIRRANTVSGITRWIQRTRVAIAWDSDIECAVLILNSETWKCQMEDFILKLWFKDFFYF